MRIPPRFLLSAQADEPRTLCDILLATAEAHPDAAAVDDGEVVLSYGQLLALIRRTTTRLAAVGVGHGSRVGIRMPSGSHGLYVTILATLFAGAAYVLSLIHI